MRHNVESSKVLKQENGQGNTSIHPIRDSAECLLASSKQLLASYNTISNAILSNADPLHLDKDWEGDCQRLQSLLDVGRKVNEKKVKRLLASEEEEDVIAGKEAGEPWQRIDDGDITLWKKLTGKKADEDTVKKPEKRTVAGGQSQKKWIRA